MEEVLEKHITSWTIELQVMQERQRRNPRDFEAIAMIGVARHQIDVAKDIKSEIEG